MRDFRNLPLWRCSNAQDFLTGGKRLHQRFNIRLLLALLFLHLQLLPRCAPILFPRKNKPFRLPDNNFRSGVNQVFRQQVSAGRLSEAVADAQVQVAAIHADRAYEADDFKMTVRLRAYRLIGKAQIRLGQAAHAGHYPPGLHIVSLGECLDFLFKVLPRLEAKSMDLQVGCWHCLVLFTGEKQKWE